MSTRTLALMAIAGSPFLAIDFIVHGYQQPYQPSSLTGVFSFLYMTGWMCSILALYRLKAAGDGVIGKSILMIQLVMLTLGELWNVYAMFQPNATTTLFKTLDLFWPISNGFMLVTGLVIIRAKKLHGWKPYIPFAAGLWLPLSFGLIQAYSGGNTLIMLISGAYSAITWLLLGISVYVRTDNTSEAQLVETIALN